MSNSMNPATLLRLHRAWDDPAVPETAEVHILAVAAMSGAWPSTVRRAALLGYFHRPRPGMLVPTPRLTAELARVSRIRKVQDSAMRYPDRVAARRTPPDPRIYRVK